MKRGSRQGERQPVNGKETRQGACNKQEREGDEGGAEGRKMEEKQMEQET